MMSMLHTLYFYYHFLKYLATTDRQTPAIISKQSVAKFTSSLQQSYDLHKIKLAQKVSLLEQVCFTGSMPLPTLNRSIWTCGCPEVFTSTTILRKCDEKTSSGVQECYIL